MTSSPDPLLAEAVFAHQAGRLDEAETLFRQAIAKNPDVASAHAMLGALLLQRGALQEAVACFDAALKLNPAQETALSNRGHALNQLGQFDGALESLDRALALNPAYAAAHNNRGLALRGLKRYGEALESFASALRLKPDFTEAENNRANVLADLHRHDEALAVYDRLLAAQPGFAAARFSRGKALSDLGRYDDALADFERLIAQSCERMAAAQFAKALIKLRQGDFAGGWKLYEWRWKTEDAEKLPHHDERFLWRGETSIAGKTILIHGEQGFGDTLQFCRYIPMVKAIGARVLAVIQPELADVLSPVLQGCDVFKPGDKLPAFDAYCLLMSLPLAFKTTLRTIPAEIPYLAVPAAAQDTWRMRLGEKSKRRIGLAWSGRPTHVNDGNRSIPFDLLRPLLDLDAEFHSLQKDVRPADLAALGTTKIIRHENALADFSDTAALIDAMDMVISVDTAVAHLAGAMGKTVRILLPFSADFRWLLGRDDSPWYPTAKLDRQTKLGDWASVIDRLVMDLK